MKKLIPGLLWGVLMLICLGDCAFAQDVWVTATGPNPNYYWYDSYYNANVSVGPYLATVAGQQNQQVICDDYSDETNIGDKWTASVLNMSNLSLSTLGSTMWGATMGATQTVLNDYLAVAWLTEKLIVANAIPNNGAVVAALQYAIWGIFNSNALGSNAPPGALADYKQVMGMVGQLNAKMFSNLEILTPLNDGSICHTGQNCDQEFLMQVPEGGAALLYLLLAGISCFGAMFIRSRRVGTASPRI